MGSLLPAKAIQHDAQTVAQYKHYLLTQFESYRHTLLRQNGGKFSAINMNVAPDAISGGHVCRASMHDLQGVTIAQLQPNTIHYGKKLCLTTITATIQQVGVTCIVQDTDEYAIGLSIYNFVPSAQSVERLEQLLPKNTDVIIKEPYLRLAANDEYVLRIDNPHTNLVIGDNCKQCNDRSSMETETPHIYIGDIAIQYIDRAIGRGVFATNEIARNALILDEACIAYQCGVREHERLSLSMDAMSGQLKINDHDWRQNIINIYAHGSLADKYKLSTLLHTSVADDDDGDSELACEPIVPSMALFRDNALPEHIKSEDDITVLSAAQIQGLIEKNAHCAPTDQTQCVKEVESGQHPPRSWYYGGALFVLASFFNHSAKPNATWSVHNKRIEIHALQDIQKGEEIVVSYGHAYNAWN